MKREALENINTELFNSFNAQENIWGGSGNGKTIIMTHTFSLAPGGQDHDQDFLLDINDIEPF